MTASTVKSSKVSGYESVPVTLQPGSSSGNGIVEYKGSYEVATTSIDETGDIMRLDLIPSKLRISEIVLFNDDLDSNGSPALTVDVGFYRPASGTVLDADAIATASTVLQAANLAGARQNNAASIANLGKQAWEYCSGVTSDPGGYIDFALTVVTAAGTAAAGTVSWCIRGSLDN